jgi:hypothetical protein
MNVTTLANSFSLPRYEFDNLTRRGRLEFSDKSRSPKLTRDEAFVALLGIMLKNSGVKAADAVFMARMVQSVPMRGRNLLVVDSPDSCRFVEESAPLADIGPAFAILNLKQMLDQIDQLYAPSAAATQPET